MQLTIVMNLVPVEIQQYHGTDQWVDFGNIRFFIVSLSTNRLIRIPEFSY